MRNTYKNLGIFLSCAVISSCNPEDNGCNEKNTERDKNKILQALTQGGIMFETCELEEINEFFNNFPKEFSKSDVGTLFVILLPRNPVGLYEVQVAAELIELKSEPLMRMFQAGINLDLNDLGNIAMVSRSLGNDFF